MSYLSYRPSYYLTRPHEFIRETYLEIKWFIQRGRRGWADSDVWGFDSYLSCVIYEGIGRLRESPVLGYPADFPEGTDNCLSADVRELTCEEGHNDRFEEWDQMLGKIAKGFEAWSKRDDWFGTPEYDEYKKLPTKEAVEMSNKKDQQSYDSLQESLELFKKYFVNLWD